LPRYFGALKFHFSWTKFWRACCSRRILPFSFSITRLGALYIVCVFLLALTTIQTGINLLFLILATLLAAIAVSGVISRNSLKQISLSLQLPENVFVGEKVFLKISMKNTKRIFPSYSICAEDPAMSRIHSPFTIFLKLPFLNRYKKTLTKSQESAILRQSAYFPILRAGETRSELIVQSFPKRGMYRLDGFWISTRFPFGFFRRGQRIGATGEVLVYPSIQEIPPQLHNLPFLSGILEGSRVGPGENLFSMRKYQEGESSRIIDWKATSKTGELMAREFARDEESKFCLILDTRIHEPAEDFEKNFENAVSLSASIAAYFLEEGAGIEFLTPDEYMARGSGRNHLYRILRSLAVVQCRKTSPLSMGELWEKKGFPNVKEVQALQQILSDKIYKIIITSQPKGLFPAAIWRSSHVIYFNDL
jgi:uncharacterized protein (DUF58 family)